LDRIGKVWQTDDVVGLVVKYNSIWKQFQPATTDSTACSHSSVIDVHIYTRRRKTPRKSATVIFFQEKRCHYTRASNFANCRFSKFLTVGLGGEFLIKSSLPVFTGRVHGPCLRAPVHTTREHGLCVPSLKVQPRVNLSLHCLLKYSAFLWPDVLRHPVHVGTNCVWCRFVPKWGATSGRSAQVSVGQVYLDESGTAASTREVKW